MKNCPICSELLVFPREGYSYCEDCGWPDEDFGGQYAYPEIGVRLENIHGLEFYSEKFGWGPSGVISAKVRPSLRGLYRYKIPSNKDNP